MGLSMRKKIKISVTNPCTHIVFVSLKMYCEVLHAPGTVISETYNVLSTCNMQTHSETQYSFLKSYNYKNIARPQVKQLVKYRTTLKTMKGKLNCTYPST